MNPAALAPATDPHQAAAAFLPGLTGFEIYPHGSGHIHHTYHVCSASTGAGYLLQRLNERVFPDTTALMENFQRIEAHLRSLHGDGAEALRRRLRLVPTPDGQPLHRAPDGSAWRLLHFIPDALSHDTAPGLAEVTAAAAAFGSFQRDLSTLPGPPLHTTLPSFHHTPARLATLEAACTRALPGRLPPARAALEILHQHRGLAHALDARALPIRTVHNDTKLNNVLFDRATGRPLAVVDWDTTMPGLIAHDFGDMVRTTATPCAEDEPELDRVHIDPALFAALAHGYLQATCGWLTREEQASLFTGAQVILYEQALRFLTDHLLGDLYYPVSHPGHNLHRCRVQLALLTSLHSQRGRLQPLLT